MSEEEIKKIASELPASISMLEKINIIQEQGFIDSNELDEIFAKAQMCSLFEELTGISIFDHLAELYKNRPKV